MSAQTKECDLLIIGGGPAGLSAAINGASEGLAVTVIDNGSTFGGQARESNAIENYPGFPEGVAGDQLMSNLVRQAFKFKADMLCPIGAVKLREDHSGLQVTCDDYSVFQCRSVILTLGLSYRRLPTRNLSMYLGYGAYYGMPHASVSGNDTCQYIVVGGANSAGQAAMHLSQNVNAVIHVVVRGKLSDKMSAYLLNRIREAKNITVHENTSVTEVGGEGNRLEWAEIEHGNGTGERLKCKCLFIFIGASPRTYWLEDTLELDNNKFIKTWQDINGVAVPQGQSGSLLPVRARLPYETSINGVFACGDVRLNSTKRVASAVGEGANALQMTHRYLDMERKSISSV